MPMPIKSSHNNGPGKPYDILYHLSYPNLSSNHKNIALTVSTHFEPKVFHQAIKFPHWREAMASKISALEKNNTWLLTHFPAGKTAIACK